MCKPTSFSAAAAEIFINCLRQRRWRRRLENLSKFSVIGGGSGGSAARLTPLPIMFIFLSVITHVKINDYGKSVSKNHKSSILYSTSFFQFFKNFFLMFMK
jgi:hypothetical protein